MMTDTSLTVSDDHRRLETRVLFNADAPVTISTSNASGRVEVRTDPTLPSGTIAVTATRTDNNTFEDDDHHLTVKTEDNTVSIHPDWQFAAGVSGLARRLRDQLQHGFRPEDWNLSRLRLRPELDFHISILLPQNLEEGSQVKVRTASGTAHASDITANASIVTASGDVEARNLTGTIAIHTASGDVDATNINESLEINTASGDVSVRGGDAWLAARSASGDVEIHEVALRNVRITTVSGDVTMASSITNIAASHTMETVSGDIQLNATLPGSDAVATLGFGTISGSSNVGGSWEKHKRREWRAGSGTNAISINVKTVSGDLSSTATLDPALALREMELPRGTAAEADTAQDFKDEMVQFGKEMRQFGEEMKRTADTPDAPPAPPTPPQHTPPPPPAPPVHPHGNEHIFTAGPSGKPYRANDANQAQPTEPVSAPEPFTDEPEPTAAETRATDTGDTTPIVTPEPQQDERLRLLEAVERGEMDIEEALAQLNDDSSSESNTR